MGRLFSTVTIMLTMLPGCMRPGEERALSDREAGKASAGGLTMAVDDGLAAVQSMSGGELVLWANAPELRGVLTADAEAPDEVGIEVRNSMPQSVLRAYAADGSSLVVTLLTRPFPTDRRWLLHRAAEERVKLELTVPARSGPWRFGVLSDIQEGITTVTEIYDRINQETEVAFMVSSGDLTSDGTRAQQERFQEVLGGLRIPFFATVGNHDVDRGTPALWRELYGRHSEHFTYRGVDFYLVDSGNATIDPLVYDELDTWVSSVESGDRVFVTHFPPIDPIGSRNGSLRSRAEAGKLVTRLAEGGVDVAFYGHVHSYYAFAHDGVSAYISGGGGAIPETLDGMVRHYLTVEVDDSATVRSVDLVRVDR